MKNLHWLTGYLSNRKKALLHYKRGLASAVEHDHQSAIDHYTSTIGVPNLPPDLIALVRYSRALVYVAVGDDRSGVDDLKKVLSMKDGPSKVKRLARKELARIQSQYGERNS